MYYVYGIDGLQFKGGIAALQHHRKMVDSCGRTARVARNPANQAVKTYDNMMRIQEAAKLPMPVSQIMSSPVLTVNRYQSLFTAWRLLKESNIRQLVVTSEKCGVIGILTERDILQHISVKDGEIEADRVLPVADILQQEIFATESTSDVGQVAGVMTGHRIDAIAIIDRQRAALGIVTRGDILRCFAANRKINLRI